MISKNFAWSRAAVLGLVLTLGACAGADREIGVLMVQFEEDDWTGKAVAKAQTCRKFDGQGASPMLRIAGIPDGATDLLIAFNDESDPPMNGGGHGILRLPLSQGQAAAMLPNVPGESDRLPAGVFSERPHRGKNWSGSGGAYLPPCSGGKGHLYSATVTAVSRKPGQAEAVLARGKIALGTY